MDCLSEADLDDMGIFVIPHRIALLGTLPVEPASSSATVDEVSLTSVGSMTTPSSLSSSVDVSMDPAAYAAMSEASTSFSVSRTPTTRRSRGSFATSTASDLRRRGDSVRFGGGCACGVCAMCCADGVERIGLRARRRVWAVCVHGGVLACMVVCWCVHGLLVCMWCVGVCMSARACGVPGFGVATWGRVVAL